eukprot:TRINITY_DN7937_c1_g1_i2.p1 TRINITY_DN7937_c1_g1~~TRINITY_DN7937_c1_g1_i2.p1  ORF type:complete len:191 (+),score=5.84 TRINITY_DN7937_c1_g1_i2:472-1044(+)
MTNLFQLSMRKQFSVKYLLLLFVQKQAQKDTNPFKGPHPKIPKFKEAESAQIFFCLFNAPNGGPLENFSYSEGALNGQIIFFKITPCIFWVTLERANIIKKGTFKYIFQIIIMLGNFEVYLFSYKYLKNYLILNNYDVQELLVQLYFLLVCKGCFFPTPNPTLIIFCDFKTQNLEVKIQAFIFLKPNLKL